MSVNNETSRPTPRTKIFVDESPAPPWSAIKFICEKCGAEFQLEAADPCKLRRVVKSLASYDTPACWDCGHINVITAAPQALAIAVKKEK